MKPSSVALTCRRAESSRRCLYDLTKWCISSSSCSSFVFAGRPRLFWWPLWKCPPRSPDTLPNTPGRAQHSSAAASPHPASQTNQTPTVRLFDCDIKTNFFIEKVWHCIATWVMRRIILMGFNLTGSWTQMSGFFRDNQHDCNPCLQ